jgi:hypothetical protein
MGEGVAALEKNALEPDLRSDSRAYPNVREFLSRFSVVPRGSFLARLFGADPVPPRLRTLFRHASGDVAVADALGQLGPDWLVLHAVPVGRDGADVDHIAIGPAGVHTIAVRYHAGEAIWIGGGVILVDGERMPHIRDAEFEAVRATQLLSDAVGTRVEAVPCLVIVEPRSLTVAKPPRRVAVLTPRELRPWLRSLPRVYSAAQLGAFVAAASERGTWHDTRNPNADVAECLDRFRRVQTVVGQARHVRLTWITGALVLFWLVAVIGIGGFTTGLLFR